MDILSPRPVSTTMESRLRRFKWYRRNKKGVSSDLQATPYHSASQDAKAPIFIYQSLNSNNRAASTRDDGLSLKAFAYDTFSRGKSPTFGDQPIKGNGPVKLQANRRAESGELQASTAEEDQLSTLQDIRRGEYLVARKSRFASFARSTQSSGLRRDLTTPAQRPATATPTTRSPWRQAPSTPSSPTAGTRRASVSQNPLPPLPLELGPSPSWRVTAERFEKWNSSVPELSQAAVVTPEEQNATIAALQRAEVSRLVDIYGQHGVERRGSIMSGHSTKRPMSRASAKVYTHALSVMLAPLPPSAVEAKPSPDLRRTSRWSGASNRTPDDTSDTSDTSSHHRASMISSCAGSSSYTTQTSVGEADHVSPKDDIRKMIEDMRSTYLKALDAHPQPGDARPPQKTMSLGARSRSSRRKRRSKPATGAKSTEARRLSGPQRKTWHAQAHPDPDTTNDLTGRALGAQPVATFGRLSPIAASPSHPEPSARPYQPELKRADSLTLGSLLAEVDAMTQPSPIIDTRSQPPSAPPSEPLPPPPAASPHQSPRPPTPREPSIGNAVRIIEPVTPSLPKRVTPTLSLATELPGSAFSEWQYLKQPDVADVPSISPSEIRFDNFI